MEKLIFTGLGKRRHDRPHLPAKKMAICQLIVKTIQTEAEILKERKRMGL